MRRFGSSIPVWSLMVAVGLAGVVSFAVARVETAHYVGMGIVAACVVALAYRRYCDSVSLRQMQGLSTSRVRKVGLGARSVATAAVVIGLADLSYLAGYHGFMRIANATAMVTHWSADFEPPYMLFGGVIGVSLALHVAVTVGHIVDARPRTELERRRLRVGLGVIVVVLFIWAFLVAAEVAERRRMRLFMAEYHGSLVVDGSDSREATLHAWLEEWYVRAAWRPWWPDHPNEIPTGVR
jgi:hypothetical protein